MDTGRMPASAALAHALDVDRDRQAPAPTPIQGFAEPTLGTPAGAVHRARRRFPDLLKRRLGDRVGASEHFLLYGQTRAARFAPVAAPAPSPAPAVATPPLRHDEVVIVSALPRSGTSMLMQMLVAGILAPLTDGARADEDNPLSSRGRRLARAGARQSGEDRCAAAAAPSGKGLLPPPTGRCSSAGVRRSTTLRRARRDYGRNMAV
jgi:hypothetical protein